MGGAGLEPAASTTQFYLLCDPTFSADLGKLCSGPVLEPSLDEDPLIYPNRR